MSTPHFEKLLKLKGASNYEEWYTGLTGALEVTELWGVYILEEIEPIRTNYKSVILHKEARLKWLDKIYRIRGHITLTLENRPQNHVKDIQNPHAKIAKLAELYKAQGYTTRHQLVRPLIQRILKDYKEIAEYGDAVKGSLAQIRAIGYEIKNEWLITSIFMHELGSDYKDLIDIILNTRPRNDRGQFEKLDFNDALK